MEFKLTQIIEALLLSASRPVDIRELQKLFDEDLNSTQEDIKKAIKEIEVNCEDRGFILKKVASGYRLQVRQELSEYVAKLWAEKPQKYSIPNMQLL